MTGGQKKKKLILMLPMLHQGGFERVAVATARLLSEDYDVVLCIFSDRNIHYDVSGLEIINLDVPSEKSRFRKVINVAKRAVKAGRVRRETGADIVYSFGNTANLVNIFSRTSGRTLTGLRCGTDLENPWIVRQCIKRSDIVLSCSMEIEELLKRDFGCRRSAYIYNPLDVEKIISDAGERAVEKEAGTFVIATMGRDDRIKAHWHMIKAFAIAAEKHSELRLLIIGAGKYEQYRKLAEALGVADRITFTGALKNPFPEVSSADLYVLPSNREGFPNALIEAMALGRPVIATDCRTGPREILLSEEEHAELLKRAPAGTSTEETVEGRYGILVPDMTSEINTDPAVTEKGEHLLAAQIVRMAEDRELRDRYAAMSLERTKMYRPANYRRDLIKILEGL